ncbi:lysosomal cobalamin transporter ABCD4-like [Amphiura filiformis]|uniref:lysosomal cobalamin transporter ABCD4-like n=1 Tax=Amphiura filiformis TaxID=82378 RepID=UPI003B21D2B1
MESESELQSPPEVNIKSRKDSQDAKKYRCDFLFLKRFRRILGLCFPGCFSPHTALFLLLLIVAVGEQIAVYYVGLIPSEFYSVLPVKNFDGFMEVLWQSLLYIILIAVNKSARQYISSLLYIRWREALTAYIHKYYFRNFTYYQLNVLRVDSIDNPDQRITQDVERLCNQFSQIISLFLISPFTVAFYTYNCYVNSGWIGPVSIYLFFIIGTVINKFVMSPVVNLTFCQQRKEGAFRFKHMQIRSNAESAAFYVAGDVERAKTNHTLFTLLDTQLNVANWEFWLHIAVNMFDYLGSILSYVVIAVPIFAGAYDNLTSDELYSLISQNSFVSMYLIFCFSQLIDLSNQISDIAAYSHRIGELIESLKSLPVNDYYPDKDDNEKIDPDDSKLVAIRDTQKLVEEEADISSRMSPRGDINGVDSQSIASGESLMAFQLDQVAICPPDKEEVLVKDLNLEITSSRNLMITGATGSGKTSILRVLHGMWPTAAGSVDRYPTVQPRDVMFLPQKPFLSDGTLREQIMYPAKVSSTSKPIDDDDKLLDILARVGLLKLYNRIGGFDVPVEWNWSDVMTPGEMQCLSFARLFYARPKFAILDEATSALTITHEDAMYRHCSNLNMTIVSVGHRETLRKFHDCVLHLDGKGGWTMRSLNSHN